MRGGKSKALMMMFRGVEHAGTGALLALVQLGLIVVYGRDPPRGKMSTATMQYDAAQASEESLSDSSQGEDRA
jgi:hypothetical protein